MVRLLEPDLAFKWRYPVKELCLNLETNLISMGKTEVPAEVVTPTAGKVREICLSGLFFVVLFYLCFMLPPGGPHRHPLRWGLVITSATCHIWRAVLLGRGLFL